MYQQNSETCLQKLSVKSKDKLTKVLIFLLNYPDRYIPVCDNGKLTGTVDKLKLANLSKRKLERLTVQHLKEDAPFIALKSSSTEVLEKEMRNKRIEHVFIIDNEFNFKGIRSISLVQSKSVFDRLFDISIDERREV